MLNNNNNNNNNNNTVEPPFATTSRKRPVHSLATTFPKYQNSSSQITIDGTSLEFKYKTLSLLQFQVMFRLQAPEPKFLATMAVT